MRVSEKKRHELAAQAEEAQADKDKEIRRRAKADLYCQQLEEELDSIKTRKAISTPRRESDADVVKLRSELEKMKDEHEEKLSREKKRMSLENTVSLFHQSYPLKLLKVEKLF